MVKQSKTNEKLIRELTLLKERIADLEGSQSVPSPVGRSISESEAKYRRLFESATIGIFQSSREGRVITANQVFASMFGYESPEDVISSVKDVAAEMYVDPRRRQEIVRLMTDNPNLRSFENIYRRKDGSTFTGNLHIWPVFDADGSLLTIEGFVEDISERKRADEELKKNRRFLSDLIEHSGALICVKDREGRYELVNSKWEEVTGISRLDTIGRKDAELFPGPTGQQFRRNDLEVMESGSVLEVEESFEDGQKKRIFISVKFPLRGDDGVIRGICGMITEITARKEAEEELLESRRRLEDIIEFLPDATLVIDQDGKVIAWNRAIEAMTGVRKEDMLGKGNYAYALPFYGIRRPILIDYALHPDGEMENQYTTIQRMGDCIFGEAYTPNLQSGDMHMYATASVLHDSKGNVIAAIECIRDNTDRKRLAERLARAEKMEGLGRLAGGVAHDLNNILGVLVGYSELLGAKLPQESPLRSYADTILQAGLRGAAIIQDLLTLARRGVAVSEVVDLNRIVSDYLKTPEYIMLRSEHGEVKVRIDLTEGLLNIKGSPIHLSKTIANLVANAAESISGSGEISIKTENRYLDVPLQGYDDMREGDYTVLTVSDTGKGIPAKEMGKIFEPFYTRKVMGRSGTGLGLAVVWGTVKDHNGYVDVRSEVGKGSTFSIYLPVTREKAAAMESVVDAAFYMGKGEKILVVDDVKEQRELAVSMLESLGYEVEAVDGGEEAIDYLRNGEADLIVLDMIMEPGIDGLETYQRVIESNPRQRAVIVSGYSETDRVRKAQEMGAGVFVRKPYVLEKIALAVRRELDRQ